MLTHSIVDGPGGESRLKRRKTHGAFGKDDSAEDSAEDQSLSASSQEDGLALVAGRASGAVVPGRPGSLNPEVRSLMEKFVSHYVDPKHQNARMSSLQLNPHFYPYYHENPLSSSERERVMTTLAESFSGLEFKGNQFFLEQVFRLRPNVLQYIKWVPFEQLTKYGGSRLRGNEVVMDQWIFSTEALEPGSRQVPGQLLNSQRQQDTQAVYNYGVGFRTSLDYFMEPTKLNAYNKNLEALSATILQTMEKQLLQTLFRQSTHYRHKNKYTLPFASEQELSKALSALCNERFAIQKNGAGIRSLESNAFNELRNIGLTPQSVLLSPEVMRHEKVVNPENRILGRVGKSAQESAPAKDGSGYDLQTVRGMQTPTYGLAVNQSRSFRNMDTEEFEDPTHTDMYNSSRWSMHPLPHEHENSSKYRTAHRTIGIVDGDREEIRYLTLHDVLEESGMWERDGRSTDGSHKKWSAKMEVFLKKIARVDDGDDITDVKIGNICRGSMTDRVVRAIIRKVLQYSSDPDAHPEIHELWRLVVQPMIPESKTELPRDEVIQVLRRCDTERKYFGGAHPPDLPELKESGIDSEEECKRVFEHFMAMQVFHDGPALIEKVDVESVEARRARWRHNWGLFHAYCAQRQGEDAKFNRTELTYESVKNRVFTAGLACAMLEADVPFPLSFNIFRMHEKFVGGGAVYFNRQSVVMAVKSCSLLTTNDADTFQTEVQVKFQAGAVVLDKRSLLAQHNIVAVRYEEGAGTVFHDWSGRRRGGRVGQGPRADLIAIPLPCDEAPRQLYSCILGKVPECLVPTNSQDSVSDCCQGIYTSAIQHLPFNGRDCKDVSIFEPEGVLQPRPEDQIIAMRGACLRYDIHSQRMADTHEGRTALGKACSVEQFQQLKGLGSDLGGDGVRGATFHTQGAFYS